MQKHTCILELYRGMNTRYLCPIARKGIKLFPFALIGYRFNKEWIFGLLYNININIYSLNS